MFVQNKKNRRPHRDLLCLLPVRDGDTIPLPDTYIDAIVKLTRMVLNNAEADVMTQAVMTETDAIVPRRKWNNARAKLPFFV